LELRHGTQSANVADWADTGGLLSRTGEYQVEEPAFTAQSAHLCNIEMNADPLDYFLSPVHE
jgi:hypothetical protein